ncbi:MAG: triose-phosphate isomerase [Candidatus Tagabacteria bacterium CG09_land_8_20_14_0_10_41_14]|uniref:Triosephosphate isomerase n=2 Tax=Candidatus Tagaibacteriota TaxID=1817918 RepID=A0A2H0WLG1_9BACT|nr:MAG: triose-phosphate isomerase [Candidatus Tagabacteria bacterium CG09_land_8_20_14_0_10_41_14]PJE73119.1 MAG: triose-phosphate isomerase [Candidatus Tagabacteria bacterium CG10_big_fil_rev_8_21_14_0_10_40_13]
MAKKFIVANWKMNPNSVKEAEALFIGVCKSAPKMKNTEVVVCPPFVYLDRLSGIIHNAMPIGRQAKYKNQINLGSQDVFWENRGSYTGEISPLMLKDFGVKYVIVGHSERRKYLMANNEIINKKIKTALKNNLKVFFCVGEEERDEKGKYLKFLKEEIIEGFKKIPKDNLKNLFIVYEPIWAISSNKGAAADTPRNFLETSIYIRKILFFRFGRKVAHKVPILYGGSVDGKNARGFLEEGRADGILAGRAGLKVKSFVDILKSLK